MAETFYKKVGRKYIPVREYDSKLLDSLPDGFHLIAVSPGQSSCRYKIDPALAPLIAAGLFARESMVEAIHKSSEARVNRQLTERQQQLWQELNTEFGDSVFYIQYPAAVGIADAGINAIVQEAHKLLLNPAVKKAYDQFLLVYQLSKDSDQISV